MTNCCSKSKHTIWLSLVIATFIGCGMLLYLSYHYTSKNQSSKNSEENNVILSEKLTQAGCHDVCLSKECVLAANYLLENMDPDVDPCEDFYSFACGKWMNKFSDHDNYTVIEEMGTNMKKILKDLLDNLKGEEGGKSEKLKIVYDSCMNKDSSEYNVVRTIKEFLHELGIEGWPDLAPASFRFAESSMERTVARLAAYNQISLIKFFPTEHERAGAGLFNITVRDDAPLVLDVSEWKPYRRRISKIMSLLGTSSERAEEAWESFREVDTGIYKLMEASSSSEEETLQYINCKSETADKVVQICEALKYFVNYSGVSGLFFDDRAYFPESHYNENILPLMRNFTQWQVANYLSLRLILSQLDVMSLPFRSLTTSSPELGSQFCVGWVSLHLSHAVAQQLFPKLPTGQLEEMASIAKTYIQEAEIYISNQKWIEECNRIRLENSIRNVTDSMSALISYLSKPSTYDSILDNYNPTNESFLRNVLEHNKNILKFYMLNFKALQTEEFPQGFFKVAAYHSEGSIEIRFGLFLPPVYKHGLPKLLNLATMGSAIGHEIGHEIELFFEENLNETVKKGYEEKKACLEDQFSQYEIQKIGKNVKGNETSLENMADLIGMEITQQVIKKYNTHENFLLPALNLTTKQILYLSQAQMWCSVRSKANEQLHYDEDVHAPNALRVNGMMRNLLEFSTEYNCSTNSKMNSIKRCSFRG